MILKNALFASRQMDDTFAIYRILFVSEPDNVIVYFDIDEDKKEFPVVADLDDFEYSVNTKAYLPCDTDPYEWLQGNESEYSAAQISRRDRAWEAIEPIVNSEGLTQFDSKQRGILVAQQKKKTGRIEKTMYRDLRRYWRRGQMRNALISNYHKSGGKGKKKQYKDGIKPGRPSRLELHDGQRIGKALTDEIYELLLGGIRKYYLTRKGLSLRQAYTLTLKEHFTDRIDYVDGEFKELLQPIEELPTFYQFENIYKKEIRAKEAFIGRQGRNKYQRTGRKLLSDSMGQILAPGSEYQIDATKGDIYLRHQSDPEKIVGRATIYFAVDTFSRMIVGYYTGFRNPSWDAAGLTLVNAMSDKVAHCKKYEVDITTEDWPSVGKPATILVDRSEFLSNASDSLVDALDITVKNTIAYRGDHKGIVERAFRSFNDSVLRKLPGHVRERERGDREIDYREEALLDIDQLNRIVIKYIRFYNKRKLASYPLSREMIDAKVESNPLAIWQWGVRHAGGVLRNAPSPNVLRRTLFPQGEASITEKGIRYKGLFYYSQHVDDLDSYDEARIKNRWNKIPILYHPDNTSEIYIRNGADIEVCPLIGNTYNNPYRDLHFMELEADKDSIAIMRDRATESDLQEAINLNAEIEQAIEDANPSELRRKLKGKSKRSQIMGIRDNHAEALESEKQLEFSEQNDDLKLDDDTMPESDDYVIPAHVIEADMNEDEPEYIPPAKHTDLLRKRRKRQA